MKKFNVKILLADRFLKNIIMRLIGQNRTRIKIKLKMIEKINRKIFKIFVHLI